MSASTVKVSRSDGRSEIFRLDTADNLDKTRAALTAKTFMTARDVFLMGGTEIDRGDEAATPLSDVLKDGGLSIGEPTGGSPIDGGDTVARYNQLRTDQKLAIFANMQIFRGLTFTKDGFDKTFEDVYAWQDGYLPDANMPRINTELTTNYSFSKVTRDLTVFGSSSTSVSFSSPYASGEAEFKNEQSKSTSSSLVKEYLVSRYIVRKVLLQASSDKLVASKPFLAAVKAILKDNEDSIERYYNLIQVLNKWGYYIPLQFTLGGVIYATDETTISDYSEAESQKEEFSGSVKASFDGIGGSAAYKQAHGSDSKTTSSNKFQNTTLQLIGGRPGTEKDYPAWAKSLEPPVNWNLAEAPQLYPTLMLLAGDDEGRQMLGTVINMIEKFAGYPAAPAMQPYLDMKGYNTVMQEMLNPF